MKPLIIILSLALALSCAIAAESISVSGLRQVIKVNASGVYIVKDVVDRISITLTPGEYEIRMGGHAFVIHFPIDSDVKYSFSNDTIFMESKGSSARHSIGSRHIEKTPLVQVGQSLSLSVVLSDGKFQGVHLLTDRGQSAATAANDPTLPGSGLRDSLGTEFNVTSPEGFLGSGKTDVDGSVSIQTIDGMVIELKPKSDNPMRFSVSTSREGYVGTGRISDDGSQLIVNTTTGQVVRFRIR